MESREISWGEYPYNEVLDTETSETNASLRKNLTGYSKKQSSFYRIIKKIIRKSLNPITCLFISQNRQLVYLTSKKRKSRCEPAANKKKHIANLKILNRPEITANDYRKIIHFVL